MKEYVFPSPDIDLLRDPSGRPYSDYCLADDRAITCTGGEETAKPFAQHIVRALLGDKSFEVDEFVAQPEIGLTISGKRSRLDLLIVGEGGQWLDFEAQKGDEKHLVDRLSTYTAELILRKLGKGSSYGDLTDIYLAFACKSDLLATKLAVDPMEMVHLATGEPAGAKFHWIVLSLANLDNPTNEREWLLHDMFCKDTEMMHSDTMKTRLQYLRTEEGIRMMFETRAEESARKFNEGVEVGKAEGIEIGKAKGKAEGLKEGESKGKSEERKSNILSMRRKGKAADEIADLLDVDITEVEAIIRDAEEKPSGE